jgi:hypothetical protein
VVIKVLWVYNVSIASCDLVTTKWNIFCIPWKGMYASEEGILNPEN